MKINVKIINDYTARIPVWFGKIKDSFIWKNDNIDFEQSARRNHLKKYLSDSEELSRRLHKWSERSGF